jgi:hypothetical protein
MHPTSVPADSRVTREIFRPMFQQSRTSSRSQICRLIHAIYLRIGKPNSMGFWTQPHRRHRRTAPRGRVGFRRNFRSSMRQPQTTAQAGAAHRSTRLAFVLLLPYCDSLRIRASPGPPWRRIIPGVALWHPTERIWCESWTNSPKSTCSGMLPFCFRIDKIHDGSA